MVSLSKEILLPRDAMLSQDVCLSVCLSHANILSKRSYILSIFPIRRPLDADSTQELHWLDIPERVNYQLVVLTHRCLLGKAPVYLSNCCIPVSHVATRRHLRSAVRHRLSSYGRRAFAVAGPTMFNALPDDLRDPALSTATFGQ